MKTILVTGANGFIGKNLCATLGLRDNVRVIKYTRKNLPEELPHLVKQSDFIFHIAGVNRPKDESEFEKGNTDLTRHILDAIRDADKKIPILVTSSIHAAQDTPYGKSKHKAEDLVFKWSEETDNAAYVYRLPGVFGKWSRPNYNSVVATFCYNIAHDLPVTVSDPSVTLTLAYIDDVVLEFIKRFDESPAKMTQQFYDIPSTHTVNLGDLKDRIEKIHQIRSTLIVPNLEDTLNKHLYSTYISYLDTDNFSYTLQTNTDDRGWLAEFIKSNQFGQIFVSKTKPGVSRGNHWHHSKIEKFLVIEGTGMISFRNKVDGNDIINYEISGDLLTVVDIPTGYVHSITNTGDTDLITLFWANEILDKAHPDTYFENVKDITGDSNE